jgi:hypothetical protein
LRGDPEYSHLDMYKVRHAVLSGVAKQPTS